MPDLNLLDEGGMEESSVATAPAKSKSGGGGGAMKWVIIIVLAVVVVGGGGYFAKKKGIWPFKKKAPVVTEVPEDQYATEGQQQPLQEQISAADTSQVALLETAPVETKEEQPKKESSTKTSAAADETSPMGKSLSEMTGDYTIQVISYHQKMDANDAKSSLEIAGYPAYVEKIAVKGGDRYLVRIGRYGSKKEAHSAVQSFGAQLRSSYTIEKVHKK